MNKQLLALALLLSASCTVQAYREVVEGNGEVVGTENVRRGGYRRGMCGRCHEPRVHCRCHTVREQVCQPKMKCCKVPCEKVCQPRMKCCKVPREKVCQPVMKCCRVPREKVCEEKVCTVRQVPCPVKCNPCHRGGMVERGAAFEERPMMNREGVEERPMMNRPMNRRYSRYSTTQVAEQAPVAPVAAE